VLLLLLVAGQMSAELCRARCDGMRMIAQACGMHGMTHRHDVSCHHVFVNGTSTILSACETCLGQICRSVLGLLQNRPDHESDPSISRAYLNIVSPPLIEAMSSLRSRTERSTEFIPPFDSLISRFRI
jgi:hypothetical protein